jgi:hypothetical protein
MEKKVVIGLDHPSREHTTAGTFAYTHTYTKPALLPFLSKSTKSDLSGNTENALPRLKSTRSTAKQTLMGKYLLIMVVCSSAGMNM